MINLAQTSTALSNYNFWYKSSSFLQSNRFSKHSYEEINHQSKSYSSSTILLVYHTNSWDNVLTTNYLQSICETERNIKRDLTCLNTPTFSSLITSMYIYPDCSNIVGDLRSLNVYQSSAYLQDNVEVSNPQSSIVISYVRLGSCLSTNSDDSFLKKLNSNAVGDIAITVVNAGILNDEFTSAVFNSITLTIYGIILSMAVFAVYTRGIISTIALCFCILVALVTSAGFLTIFQYKSFSVFNVLSIYILIGLGGTAMMLFHSYYRENSLIYEKLTADQFASSYGYIATPFLFTIFASCISLFSKLASPVTVISQIGAYLGLAVVIFYIEIHYIYIPVYLLTNRYYIIPKFARDRIHQLGRCIANVLSCGFYQKYLDNNTNKIQVWATEVHVQPSIVDLVSIEPTSNPDIEVVHSNRVDSMDSLANSNQNGLSISPRSDSPRRVTFSFDDEQSRRSTDRSLVRSVDRQVNRQVHEFSYRQLNDSFSDGQVPMQVITSSQDLSIIPPNNSPYRSIDLVVQSIDSPNVASIIPLEVESIDRSISIPNVRRASLPYNKQSIKISKWLSIQIFRYILILASIFCFVGGYFYIKQSAILDFGIPSLLPLSCNLGQALYIVKSYKSTLFTSKLPSQTIVINSPPTRKPTSNPTNPTSIPTALPSNPTLAPTVKATNPTFLPTYTPSNPTISPSIAPTSPTNSPTIGPTKKPIPPFYFTSYPTLSPFTNSPTSSPTYSPSNNPIRNPTNSPDYRYPTNNPTSNPTKIPFIPTYSPTNILKSVQPTIYPTIVPTIQPTFYPTSNPSKSKKPTKNPTSSPNKTNKPISNIITKSTHSSSYLLYSCFGIHKNKEYIDSEVNVYYNKDNFVSYVNSTNFLSDMLDICKYISDHAVDLSIHSSWNVTRDCIYYQLIGIKSKYPILNNIQLLLFWGSLTATSSKLLGIEPDNSPSKYLPIWLCLNFTSVIVDQSLIKQAIVIEKLLNNWVDLFKQSKYRTTQQSSHSINSLSINQESKYISLTNIPVIVGSDEFTLPILANEVYRSILLAGLISLVGFVGLIAVFTWSLKLTIIGSYLMCLILFVTLIVHVYLHPNIDLLDIVIIIAIIGLIVDFPIHYILYYQICFKKGLSNVPVRYMSDLQPIVSVSADAKRVNLLGPVAITISVVIPLLLAQLELINKTGQYIIVMVIISYLLTCFLLPSSVAWLNSLKFNKISPCPTNQTANNDNNEEELPGIDSEYNQEIMYTSDSIDNQQNQTILSNEIINQPELLSFYGSPIPLNSDDSSNHISRNDSLLSDSNESLDRQSDRRVSRPLDRQVNVQSVRIRQNQPDETVNDEIIAQVLYESELSEVSNIPALPSAPPIENQLDQSARASLSPLDIETNDYPNTNKRKSKKSRPSKRQLQNEIILQYTNESVDISNHSRIELDNYVHPSARNANQEDLSEEWLVSHNFDYSSSQNHN